MSIKKMEALAETHMKGLMTVEKIQPSLICDFGIQIAENGQVWICVNGEAFIRFMPLSDRLLKLQTAQEKQ